MNSRLIFVLTLGLIASGFATISQAEKFKGNFNFERILGGGDKKDPQDLLVTLDQGETVVQTVSSLDNEMIGRIDWENNVVYAVGDGVPPAKAINPAQARVRAKRAALDEAYARLLEATKAIRVDAESTTRNFVNENRTVRTRVSGMVKNAEVVDIRQHDDGSYQIMLRMPMTGPNGIASVLLPQQLMNIQKAKVVSRTVRDDSATTVAMANKPASVKAASGGGKFTGIIIDAKGLNASPATFPRILSQSGEVLYDLTKVDPNQATNKMCEYKKSLKLAKKSPRAGNHPLVLKAVKAAGNNKVDIVLSDKHAEELLSADAGTNFLYNAKVIVVLD